MALVGAHNLLSAVYEYNELELHLYRESTSFYTANEICTLSRNDYEIWR